MAAESPPEKREVFLGLLDQGWVSVIIDARCDGVVLPEHLRVQAQVRLDYGLDMPTPIEGLDVGTDGIAATLSFNRQPCATFIPWQAVYVVAQADGAGVLYPEAVPPEMRDNLKGESGEGVAPVPARVSPIKPAAAPGKPDVSKKPQLGLVPLDAESQADNAEPSRGEVAPDAPAGDAKPRKPRARKPRLRLVK